MEGSCFSNSYNVSDYQRDQFNSEKVTRSLFYGPSFHGGMQAIAYEWGAATHTRYNSRSPDETSQSTISSAMSNFAGSLKGKRYPVGRMNQLVYPVAGGMEDWGYSGKVVGK
eukprot:gb/GECG01014709.1/.p1 GENE.gb/GECG01014709.1/~~gb/GECG01014709.1/.p1  ORF type:complete len:112 (+),score=5.31 gb/GECG01014709.1/:1-336(+)